MIELNIVCGRPDAPIHLANLMDKHRLFILDGPSPTSDKDVWWIGVPDVTPDQRFAVLSEDTEENALCYKVAHRVIAVEKGEFFEGDSAFFCPPLL